MRVRAKAHDSWRDGLSSRTACGCRRTRRSGRLARLLHRVAPARARGRACAPGLRRHRVSRADRRCGAPVRLDGDARPEGAARLLAAGLARVCIVARRGAALELRRAQRRRSAVPVVDRRLLPRLLRRDLRRAGLVLPAVTASDRRPGAPRRAAGRLHPRAALVVARAPRPPARLRQGLAGGAQLPAARPRPAVHDRGDAARLGAAWHARGLARGCRRRGRWDRRRRLHASRPHRPLRLGRARRPRLAAPGLPDLPGGGRRRPGNRAPAELGAAPFAAADPDRGQHDRRAARRSCSSSSSRALAGSRPRGRSSSCSSSPRCCSSAAGCC